MKKDKPERERKYTFNVIPTKYNGWNFRSRLEARWAIYFDGLKIPYIYEPEGILLPRFGAYLPDFFLPQHHGGAYAEVKPGAFTELELKKCRMLCRISKQCVILLDGAPEPWTYAYYQFSDGHAVEHDIIIGTKHVEEKRFFVSPGLENREDAAGLLTFEAEQALFNSRSYFL